MKLSDLKAADFTPGDCGSTMDKPPQWMDFERFQRGRDFFFNHCAASFLAMHTSLVTGLSIINLLQPLVFTGKSDTPEKSFSRYFQTFLHIALWHFEDVWDINSRAHKSVKMVRKMHNSIAERMNKARNDVSVKLYFSQYDMALVQSGFFAGITLYPEGFGIKCTKEELGDYVFFWRGIGYLLGIEDKYNLCQGSFEDTYTLVKEIEQEVLLPALRNPPKDFEHMAEAYIEGPNLQPKRQFMTKEAMFAFASEGMGLEMPGLKFLDYLRYLYIKTIVFLTRWCPYFEKMSNGVIRKMLYTELHQLKL